MKRGDKYNFRDQPERLVYMEKRDNWHRFGLVQTPNTVWVEVLDSDLHLLERTEGKTGKSIAQTKMLEMSLTLYEDGDIGITKVEKTNRVVYQRVSINDTNIAFPEPIRQLIKAINEGEFKDKKAEDE